MPTNDVMSEKKKALLAYKDKVLQEIKYYEKRIDDIRTQGTRNSFFESRESSDSEDELTLSIDDEPSAPELRQQQTTLRTRLQATLELTSLQVLQSEVNVLVDDPELDGEPPVQEPGVWREVTAECRVDLVPFFISFFVHKPYRKFGPLSYRKLSVSAVRAAHAAELRASVLNALAKPSDAVEVMKSYAVAHRSRRGSLARLADKFANTLYMEPMPDGGYLLKCANLLEVSWTLQNKWSPIAPFHHRMKFDLEYMDESYIKTITQLHRQLSDPAIDTDERTLLLARIIDTCLQAQGPTQELHESMSSDPEHADTLRHRRTTLDREPEAPGAAPREVMAPPKTVPKRARPRGKENMVDNRKKRGNSNEDMSKSKKLKADANQNQENTEKVDENIQNDPKNTDKVGNAKDVGSNSNNEAKKVAKKDNVEETTKNNSVKRVANTKSNPNSQESDKGVDNAKVKEKSDVATSKNNPKTVDSNKNTAKVKIVKEKSNLDKNVIKTKTVDSETNTNKPKMVKEKSNDKLKNVNSKKEDDINSKSVKEKGNVEAGKKASVTNKNKLNAKDTATNLNKKDSAKVNNVKSTESNVNTLKATEKKIVKKDTVEKVIADKKITNEKDTTEKPVSNKPKDTISNTKSIPSAKAKETTKTKDGIPKMVESQEKNSGNKVKKVFNEKNGEGSQYSGQVAEKIKIIKEKSDVAVKKNVPKTVDNKAQTKGVANVKNKVLPKATNDKVKKTSKTDDIERTVEKVIEKRSVAITRKSNLLDRLDGDDNVASGKENNTNKTEATNKVTGNSNGSKNVAIKRKSNFTDKESAKKRALNNNNEEKNAKKVDNNFQKTTKNKIESYKTKLMPGSIKTRLSGNTKFLSAGNIGSDKKISKIPQKLSSVAETALKKNPLRISPRKISSKFKSTDGMKSIQKTTSIPRLLKKPAPKT